MKKTLMLVIVLLLACGRAWAHHAFAAEFDGNKPIKLRGTVAKMDWINPHAWLYLDVKGTDGKVTTWMLELGPPNALIKRGWTKKDVPAGLELIVDGYLAKDGAMRANARDITFPDGKKLFAGSTGTGVPDERPEK